METAILKAAMLCASNEPTRYYLNGVYMDARGYAVSTDGHRLFMAKIDAWEGDSYIIPNEALKRVLTGNKKLQIDVSSTAIDGLTYTPIDGTFPDWARVVPQQCDGTIADFNPAYIGDIAKVAKALGFKNGIAKICHNGNAPALVLFQRKDCFMVQMPMRLHMETTIGDALSNMPA